MLIIKICSCRGKCISVPLDELCRGVVQHIVENWKRYAYLDNPSCARFYLDKIIKSIYGLNGRLIIDKSDRLKIHGMITTMFSDMGLRVVKFKYKSCKTSVMLYIVCRGQ